MNNVHEIQPHGIPRIVDFAVRQWRMTLSFLVFALVGGFLAMFTTPLDAQPDVAIPFVTVQVVLPGVSPEDAERLLVKPLETELKSLDGVKQMDGKAYTSSAVIILEFDADFEQDTAVAAVLEAVDKARGELPEDAKEPIVEEINTQTLPIIVVNIFGDAPDRALQDRAKRLQARLESNPKILEAIIQGEREDLLEAVIDPGLMESYGITFNELAGAISRNNALVAAGNLQTQSGVFSVKLPGLIENEKDLSDIVIRTDPSGAVVTMADLGNVRRTYKDRTGYARYQGRPSVSIEVSKRAGENIINTIKEVRAIVAEETKDWPDNVQVELSQDQTLSIMEMILSLVSSIINAVVLVFIVCIAALGLRSALMVGFAIPGSFFITIFLLNIQGSSINMMTMFAMVLSVGILVDSAIVIIEYADRKLAEGADRKTAYTLAGKRMFWPIVSSTATTLAAFVPLLFWNTTSGQFMSYFPKTLVYVLTASMVMALIFLPTIGALFGPKKVRNARESLRALSAVEGSPRKLKGFTGTYARTIDTLTRKPLLVLLAAVLITGSIFYTFAKAPHTVEFFTAEGGNEIYVYARARGNTAPEAEYEIAKNVEARLKGLEGVKSVFSIAGEGAAGAQSGLEGNPPIDTVSRTFLELVPFEEREPANEIVRNIHAALDDVPGLITEVEVIGMGPPIGKDITIELTSENLDKLQSAALKLSEHMAGMESLTAVENTLPLPGLEWQLDIDREEAGRLGLDVGTIGSAVQFITEGSLVGFFRPIDADEEIDIRIRYPSTERDLAKLDSLRILTRDGALPLSSVVKRTPKPRLDSINRRNQMRFYEVRANAAEGYAANMALQDIREWMEAEFADDADIAYRFLGQDEENKEASAFFMMAGIATLFMMGVILLWQFNNFWHVFLTLSAVVFSVAGVLLGLLFYPYISIMLVGVGVLALAGIVVNNNIVLIDTFHRLQESGYNAHEAAVRTAAQRMRPVFLTTVTTIIGLMPMVLGLQADLFSGHFSTKGTSTSEIWAPISYVIVCGLGFSTLLTLVLTPVMLAAPEIWGDAVKRGIARFKRGSAVQTLGEEKAAAQNAADTGAALAD